MTMGFLNDLIDADGPLLGLTWPFQTLVLNSFAILLNCF